MRIVQVVPYFYPAWRYGGPAKLVYDTSRFFVQLGHLVRVLTTDVYSADSRMPQTQRIKPSPRFKVNYYQVLSNTLAHRQKIFLSLSFFVKCLPTLWFAEIIHLHDFFSFQNVWVGWWAQFFDRPYVISPHGSLELQAQDQKSLLKKVFMKVFGRGLLDRASMLVATSDQEITTFSDLHVPRSKIFRLGHGVDETEIKTSLSKTKARQALGLPQSKVIVTFLGRINHLKGLDLLVKAVAGLKNPKIHVVIAGADDGYLAELKTLIKEHQLESKITLKGTFFGEPKAQLFKASDIFVSPSYLEAFSISVLEAASAHLPLLISTECHFPEVAKAKAGLVVEPKVPALKQGLKKLVEDEVFRKKASQNAFNLISEHYSLKHNVEALVTLYQHIIDRYAEAAL